MIKIVDNFFEEVLFSNLKNHVVNKLYYEPRYLPNTKEKNKDTYYGSRFILSNDSKLLQTFIKQSEKKFKIKIKKVHYDSGIDIRNLDHFIPHIDSTIGAKINILIMISGPTAVTNGTVFYQKGELDIHVGFRENRAILFPSDWVHSAHATNVPNLKRHTGTLFVTDYDEE
tara:strand:+ start:158 stop:670 length:513 start_codon:yes stop_codon:yes gene_type:complete